MTLPVDKVPALVALQSTELRLDRPGANTLLPALGGTARLALAGLARRGLDLRPPLRAIRDAVAPLPPVMAPPPNPPAPPPLEQLPPAIALPPPAPAPSPPAPQQWLAERVEMLETLLLTPWPAALPTDGKFATVIMPTRDRAALIPAAVASIQAQTYQSWELLIVDDGSTDDTAAAVAPFLADPRIKYTRQPHAGAPAARNAALRNAQGELIAYLDSDNEWLPDHLAKIVTAFADESIGCAYGALIYADLQPTERRILWQAFDPARLAEGNFIDLNVLIHRKTLVATYGGFDETLKRLADWDLILRYTATAPAVPVAVLSTRYRTKVPGRISDTELYHPAYRQIRAKSRQYTKTPQPIRVLYLLWHYPQASEMYVEAEIQALRRLGVHVEVWSEVPATTPYATDVPIHRGTLEAAVAAARPDVIHSHWLNIAARFLDIIAAHNLKITVRAHGFDVMPDLIHSVANHSALQTIYLYEHQRALCPPHPRLKPIRNAFETTLFRPAAIKNPRLVVRASAALPAKDLPMFLQLAKQFPTHRFVLAIVACNLMEPYVGELLALRRELESPVEILVNAPHAEVATLLGQAGIYLHTVVAPAAGGTPIGQPVSIAEAMASGCYLLTRNLPPLAATIADAGDTYEDAPAAAALIAATMSWTETEWTRRAKLSEERAWTFYSGDETFHTIHEDWAMLIK